MLVGRHPFGAENAAMLASNAAQEPQRRSMPTLRNFVDDYRRVREAEGFALADPDRVRRLPFRDPTGRNTAAWRIRAVHCLAIRAALAVIPGMERILDLGAGNGWMSRRLAGSFR